MEALKPDLAVFDDPRFAEWRRGDDCSMAEGGPLRGIGCNLREILDLFLGLFGA
jgi:hypothetical protein